MTVHWEKFAVALAHPVPVAIVRILDAEPELSPTDLSERLGLPLGRISYHVRRLVDADLIVLVRTEPRRGALEHFYRLPRNGRARE